MVQVARVDQVVAAQRLLGLHEGAVGHDVAADGRRGAGRLEGVTGDELAALLAYLLREAVVRLHDLLEHVWCRGGVAVLVLIDQDQVFGHHGCPSGVSTGVVTTPTIGAARDRHFPVRFCVWMGQRAQAACTVARSAWARSAWTAAAGSSAS